MKNSVGTLLVSLLMISMFSIVLAADNSTSDDDFEMDLPKAEKVGAFESFGDRMRLAFAFSHEKKLDLTLEFAEKRLAEIEALSETDPEAAEKAMEKYNELLAKADEYAAKLEEAKSENPNDSLSSIEKLVRAQTRLELHRERVDAIHLRALERWTEANASDEAIAKLEEIYAKELERINETESKLLEVKERSKTRLRDASGDNETEVELRVRELEDEQGLLKYREERRVREDDRLERYEEVKLANIEHFKMLLENVNLTEEQKAALEANIERFKLQVEQQKELVEKRQEFELEYEHRLEIREDGEIRERTRERVRIENRSDDDLDDDSNDDLDDDSSDDLDDDSNDDLDDNSSDGSDSNSSSNSGSSLN